MEREREREDVAPAAACEDPLSSPDLVLAHRLASDQHQSCD